MGKKRDKANENIEVLITELIDARKSVLGRGNCPYYGNNRPCEENGNDCYECKDKYFGKMEEELLEEYIVK